MIKKRNSGHGDTLTPWRVSSNQDNNYKTNVPINATLIGAMATIVPNVFIIYRFIESDTFFKFIYIVWFVANIARMPLVLFFTIKHHTKASKINPVVPRTLQFHEGEYDVDDISNEENDESIENYAHPTVTFAEVYDHVESVDRGDEDSDKANEKIVVAQIKLTEIGEASSQLPGQVCHM